MLCGDWPCTECRVLEGVGGVWSVSWKSGFLSVANCSSINIPCL
jgi:hypothetical protein